MYEVDIKTVCSLVRRVLSETLWKFWDDLKMPLLLVSETPEPQCVVVMDCDYDFGSRGRGGWCFLNCYWRVSNSALL